MELQTQDAWSGPRATTQPMPHRAIKREPVVFGHALEMLLGDLESLGPRTREALARLGLSLEAPLQMAYPSAVWAGAIHILSGALYPHLPTPKAELALGRRFTESSLQSRMGAAMNAHARLVGPERTLQRLSHNLRTMNNFLGASVHERPGGAGWELVIRPVPEFFLMDGVHGEPPHFTRGVLTTTFHAAGVSNIQMELMRHDELLGLSIFHVSF